MFSEHTFENHTNLLAYLGKLTAVYPREWFSKRYYTPRWPFSRLCASLLGPYCSKKKNCQNELLLKHGYVYCQLSIDLQLRAWAHRQSAYTQLSPLYPSLYPYVTHVISCPRSSPAFLYCKRRKAGRGLGTIQSLPGYGKVTVLVEG